ncbi:MAG: hypothetical protein WCO63_01310 [Bacteroidota bacterium]
MSEYNNFLGIGEGKRKARIEEEKRKTKQLEADLAAKNAAAAVTVMNAQGTLDKVQAGAQKYGIYAAVAIIIIIMVALYFIIKARKK